MKIEKSMLKTLWYEDEEGKRIPHDTDKFEEPEGAVYQVSEFPLELHETHIKLTRVEEVRKCKHKRKYIKRTDGWVKGVKGRRCTCCGGTQVKKWWQPWGHKWESGGSRVVFTANTHIGSGNEDVILAMANSGDYTLSEAILAYARSCERCANVLAYKYLDGKDGYAEHSDEWNRARTCCRFCESEV